MSDNTEITSNNEAENTSSADKNDKDSDKSKEEALFISRTQFNSQVFKDFAWADIFKGRLGALMLILAIFWFGIGIYKLAFEKDLIFGVVTLVIALVLIPIIALLGVIRLGKITYKKYLEHTDGQDQEIQLSYYSDGFTMLNINNGNFAKYTYERINRIYRYRNLVLLGTKKRQLFITYKTDYLDGKDAEFIMFIKEKIKENKENAKASKLNK